MISKKKVRIQPFILISFSGAFCDEHASDIARRQVLQNPEIIIFHAVANDTVNRTFRHSEDDASDLPGVDVDDEDALENLNIWLIDKADILPSQTR